VTTTAMIFFIIIGAMIFAQFLAVSQMPNYFVNFVKESNASPYLMVAFILLIYIVLGTFLDAVAMMALSLPIVFPMIEVLGINGIWFGIMVIKMTEVALITPPLGLNVYVVKGLAPEEIKLEDIFMGIMPFLLMDIVTLAIIFTFPGVVTWLPNTMR
jgi:TRAP-type C4-dicarboxylate transport system permease large subunit